MAWYKHTPTNLGWLWRGAQSAIFFYVSCAPCTMRSAAKKQKKENRRAMAERDAQMHLSEGMFYTQPLPRQTNIAWLSEINLGSNLPSSPSDRKADATPSPQESRSSSRSRNSSDDSPTGNPNSRGSERPRSNSKRKKPEYHDPLSRSRLLPNDSTQPRSRDGHPERYQADDAAPRPPRAHTAGPDSSMNGKTSLSTTLVTEGAGNAPEAGSTTSIEGNVAQKQHIPQRPMEPIWGITPGFGPPHLLKGLEDPEPEPEWYVKRNPEVNDLHPPIVATLPKSKREALWMMQPPPPAAFMEGRTMDSRYGKARRTRPAGTKRGRRRSPGHAGGNEERKKQRPAPLATIQSEGL